MGWTQSSCVLYQHGVHMTRDRRLRILVVAALLVCGTAGRCTPPVERASTRVVEGSRSFVSAAEDGLRSGESGPMRAAQENLRWTYKLGDSEHLSAPLDRLLARSRALSAALVETRHAQAQADVTAAAMASQASNASSASLRQRVTDEFATKLDEITTSTLHSIMCDTAGRYLVGNETQQAGTLEFPSPSDALQTFFDVAWSKFIALWTPAQIQSVLDWASWARSVAGIGQRLGNQTPLGSVTFGSSSHTRAFYYYLRLCHAPPG